MRPLLTRRETEVCDLLCRGKSNKQVATELGISHRTAEDHRHHIYKKIGVRNAVELLRFVHKLGEPA